MEYNVFMNEIYTKLNNVSVGNILDLATGQGNFLNHICSVFKNYTKAVGIDLSDKALSSLSEKEWDDRISFEKMDCSALQYEDESFDVVTICNSIHHFEQQDKVLAEAIRVLKKGGYLLISEMFHSADERASQKTHSDFHHWWGEIDSALGNYHGRTFTKKELLNIVEDLPLFSMEVQVDLGTDEDIHSVEIKEHLNKAYDMYVQRAEGLENKALYVKKGQALLSKLEKDGFSPASRLEFLCVK